jgi:hypothetical protein
MTNDDGALDQGSSSTRSAVIRAALARAGCLLLLNTGTRVVPQGTAAASRSKRR